MSIIFLQTVFISLVSCFFEGNIKILFILIMIIIHFLVVKDNFMRIFLIFISLIFIIKENKIISLNLENKVYHFQGKIKGNRLNIAKIDKNRIKICNIILSNFNSYSLENIEGKIKIIKTLSKNLYLGEIFEYKIYENFLRNHLQSLFLDLTEDFFTYNFFKSIILGENALDKKSIKIFKDSGLVHLLALSGLHFSILTQIFSYLIMFLKLNKKLEDIILFLLLTAYFLITYFSPSILRAYLMSSFRILSRILDEDLDIFKNFYLSAIISLLIDNTFILNLSFQMSYLATFGILLSKNKGKFYTNCIVTLFINPLQIIYFKTLNITSIFYNFIFIPIFDLIIKLMFLIIIFKIFMLPNFIIEILMFVCYNLIKATLLILSFLTERFKIIFSVKRYFCLYLLGSISFIYLGVNFEKITKFFNKYIKNNKFFRNYS